MPRSRVVNSNPPRTIKVLRVIARLNLGGPARQATMLNAALRDDHFDLLLVYGLLGASEESLEDLVVSLGLRSRKLPALRRSVSPLERRARSRPARSHLLSRAT